MADRLADDSPLARWAFELGVRLGRSIARGLVRTQAAAAPATPTAQPVRTRAARRARVDVRAKRRQPTPAPAPRAVVVAPRIRKKGAVVPVAQRIPSPQQPFKAEAPAPRRPRRVDPAALARFPVGTVVRFTAQKREVQASVIGVEEELGLLVLAHLGGSHRVSRLRPSEVTAAEDGAPKGASAEPAAPAGPATPEALGGGQSTGSAEEPAAPAPPGELLRADAG